MSAPAEVLVCGLGPTGLSQARHWSARGARVAVMDTREAPPCLGALRAELPGCRFETAPVGRMAEAGAQRDMVALSPGLAPDPFLARGCTVAGDLGCFFDALARAGPKLRPAVIAVTGTNGKSTLVSMVGSMLHACGCPAQEIGNIGLPVLDALAQWGRAGAAPQFAVVEASSFQLETAALVPARVSVVLNVSEDHLDRHGTLDRYAQIKSKIYGGAQCAAINRGDPFCAAMRHECIEESGFTADANRAREGDWRPAGDKAGAFPLSRGSDERFVLRTGKVMPALLENAAAAMAVTDPLGLDAQRRIDALGEFAPLPHRMSPAGMVGAVPFYDDSKATNVGAAIAAVRCFSDSATVLIAGGDAKAQCFSRLAVAARGRVGHFVLLGADAGAIAAALDAEGVPSTNAGTMREAVALAYRAARPQGRVILSPACSSLDMYANYAARGDDFVDSVRALSASHAA